MPENHPSESEQPDGHADTVSQKSENRFGRCLGSVDEVLLHKRAEAFYAVLIMIFTAVNVWVAYRHYRNGVEGDAEAKAQSESLIANANMISKALQESVAQNKEAMDASIASSRDDRRAWVCPFHARVLTPQQSGNITVEISYKNSGKTPAFVWTTANLLVLEESSVTDEVLSRENPISKGVFVCPPGAQGTSKITFPEKLTDGHINAIKSGQVSLFVVGRVTYDDIFNKTHHSRFCFSIKDADWKDGSMSLYWKGNTAD